MLAVSGQSTIPGGSLSASALGPIGTVAILILGLPGAPLTAPGISGEFWLDPAAYAFVAIGTPQPAAPLTASVQVPNNASFRGMMFGWQAVAVTATGLEVSNPTLTVVR